MKSPAEVYQDLKNLIDACAKDTSKAERGMKAGGVRLRAAMNDVRQLALQLRKSVLEHRRPTKKKNASGSPALESAPAAIVSERLPVPEIVEDTMIEAGKESGSSYTPYWYSNFAS